MQSSQPLRVLFMLTSMPVGGAETLLVNLLRKTDRRRIEPEVCCLKSPGPLGEEISAEFPVHANFIDHKWDIQVIPRLVQLMRTREIDALVTVGAGDKMFWGRLAAWRAGVKVVASALHSTGWPDGLGRLNRWLTPITDGFIAVANGHGKFLREQEGLPRDKVFVVPNGIEINRFTPLSSKAERRVELDLPMDVPLCAIVAALRPEKNHHRFLRIASLIRQSCASGTQFLVVGDGPLRGNLEQYAQKLGLAETVHFLGSRSDIDRILPACNLFMLTSDNEASPVSIMEAMACGLPVLAPAVGSIPELVESGRSGYVLEKTNERAFAEHAESILGSAHQAERMGSIARQRIERLGCLETMVDGYADLLERLYRTKTNQTPQRPGVGWRWLRQPGQTA